LDTFCAAASVFGAVIPFADGVPGPPVGVDEPDVLASGGVRDISCATAARCVIVDDTSALTWNPGYLSPPVVTIQPTSTTALAGRSATFTAAATGRPAPAVEWQTSSNGGASWIDIAGAKTTTLTVAAVADRWYRAVFASASGTTPSATAKLTVEAAPRVIAQPQSHGAVKGARTTFSAGSSGTPAPATRWQISVDRGRHWTYISGAVSRRLSVVARTPAAYRAVFTSAAGQAITHPATLAIWTAPRITRQPHSRRVTAGSKTTFYASATAAPPASIQWQVRSVHTRRWANIGNATHTSVTVRANRTRNGYRYRARFANIAGHTFTGVARLTVHR
jgi:hypothetical protein